MLGARAPLNLWLYASDLARSRQFYADDLGLPLWREEPGRALHFGLAGALLTIQQGSGARRGAPTVSVLLPVGRELDQICANLADKGVALAEPLADREFGRSAMIRDPDGYEIWLARPSATETQFQRWRSGGASRQRRIPINRTVAPRRHVRPARSRRELHPDS